MDSTIFVKMRLDPLFLAETLVGPPFARLDFKGGFMFHSNCLNQAKMSIIHTVFGVTVMLMLQGCSSEVEFSPQEKGSGSTQDQGGFGDTPPPTTDDPSNSPPVGSNPPGGTNPAPGTPPPVTTPPGSSDPGNDLPPIGYTTQVVTYDSESRSKQLDIVWAIDNSRSMEKPAEHVRNNFQNFASTLKSRTDVKLGLISKGEPFYVVNEANQRFYMETHASFPFNLGLPSLHLNYMVDSFNPLLVLAASTCSATSTNDESLFCRISRANERYQRVIGSFDTFFRPDSHKIFVVVTDDDSRDAYSYKGERSQIEVQYDAQFGDLTEKREFLNPYHHYIDGSTFLNQLSDRFAQDSSYRVYGFVSVQAGRYEFASDDLANYCGFRHSRVVIDSITRSGGRYFDICRADWREHFSQLTESILEYADSEYSVPSENFKQVVEVRLNGAVLGAGEVVVEGTKVKINPDLFKTIGSYRVQITYQKWGMMGT